MRLRLSSSNRLVTRLLFLLATPALVFSSSAVPVISGFSPASGQSGATVTISGTNFSPVISSNIVYFGGARATVAAANTTNLTVTVPVGVTYAPMTVTVNGLTAWSGQPFLASYLGNGQVDTGTLAGQLDLGTDDGSGNVVVGDLDGDGKPDVVCFNGHSPSVSIFRNLSTNGTLTAGSFAARVDLLVEGAQDSGVGLCLADVDGDGRLDIVVSSFAENKVSIFQNISGPGSFTTNSFAARVDLPVSGGPISLAVQDFDGDGWPDLATADYYSGSVSVLRNLGAGGVITTNAFAPQVDFTTIAGARCIAVGDFNGDGKPDLVTVNYDDGSGTMSVLQNLSSNGIVAFAPQVDFPSLPDSCDVRVGDLDGDGKLDVVIAEGANGNAVSVYRNTGAAGSISATSFAPRVDFGLDGWGNGVAIGDLDGDGKPDLAVVTQLSDHLSLFQNLSTPGSFDTGSLAPRVDFPAGWNPNGVVIGDLDGDGRPDVTIGVTYAATMSVYQNVTQFGGPPHIIAQPANQTVYVGMTANFSVLAGGTQPLNYQWNFNGTNIDGATNATLALTNVQLDQAGNYAVRVTNLLGSVASSNAVLTVNPPPPCAPVPSGLVGWWPAEGDANDVAGTNNGTLINGADFTGGEVGQTFSFDGSSYVNIPDSPALDTFASSITIEAWIKVNQFDEFPDWNGIVTKGNSSWRLARDGGSSVVGFSTTGLSNEDLAGNKNINDGQWHHVAAVYDGTNKYIYVDGTLDASVPATGTIAQNDYPMCIGENAEAPGHLWNGLIDEVSIYNRALTASEVQTVYAAAGGGKCFTPTAPEIVTQPAGQTVYLGFPAGFNVVASGTAPLHYQWNFNGTNIAGATNATLMLVNVQFSQAGNYSVLVTNVAGSVLSSNAVLTVSLPPPCTPAPLGLVGWWPAEGDAYDLIGGATGMVYSGTAFSAGMVRQAFDFDGVNGCVMNTNTPPMTNIQNTFTMEFWACPKKGIEIMPEGDGLGISGQSYAIFPNWGGTDGPAGVGVSVGTNGISVVEHADNYMPSLLSYTHAINGWTHIAVVYSNLQPVLYVNGVYVRTGLTSTRSYVYPSKDFGSSYDSVFENEFKFYGPYRGLLDEVDIFNRALSATEIQAIYVAGSGGKCSSSSPATVDHFTWNPIPSPRFINTPFPILLQARDLTNGLSTNFAGTVLLGSTNGIAINPPVSGNFFQGVWTGSVMVARTVSNLVLRADDGFGHFGLANPIDLLNPPNLEMIRSGNIAMLVWPVAYSGFVLEMSSCLSPAAWMVVPYSPIQIGDQYLLPLDMAGTNGFYRLQFPGP